MARAKTTYRCQECGAQEPKWAGRCSACEAWGSLVEEAVARQPAASVSTPSSSVPLPIAEVDAAAWAPSATHVGELDRVLQGGLVPGSVTVLGGEPGIGKSTLLLQALAGLAKAGQRCLYVTAEESAPQVRLRAERLGALATAPVARVRHRDPARARPHRARWLPMSWPSTRSRRSSTPT